MRERLTGLQHRLGQTRRPSRDNRGKRKTADGKPCSSEGDEDDEQPERLSSEDAWLFPVVRLTIADRLSCYLTNSSSQIGSVLLFGLYLVVKYFGTEWINWLLQWYFTFAGVGSVGKVSIRAVLSAVFLEISITLVPYRSLPVDPRGSTLEGV